jgi:hypothetical protein
MREFPDAKDPDDIDDFAFDWANRLDDGETITACATAIVTGDATTGASGTIAGSVTTARVSAGTSGVTLSHHDLRRAAARRDRADRGQDQVRDG